MRKILVIGAGRSSASLIKYLAELGPKEEWEVTVADASYGLASARAAEFSNVHAVELNIQDETQRNSLISSHDLVISLLPPALHIEAARDCIRYKKSLVTASYTSPGMSALHGEAIQAGITLLNECGLDPGIDHMSAMEMLDRFRNGGAEIISFRSYCGGLVAPEFENNPWKYKLTWNPMNVVLAGQATAKYQANGKLHFIPPPRIFKQTELITHPDHGVFEAYANRDSLEYIEPYGLQNAKTVLRGTLRRKGYCEAWNCLVKLGYTDNTHIISNKGLTYADLTSALLPPDSYNNLRKRLADFLVTVESDPKIEAIKWLGLLSDIPLSDMEASPAMHLLNLLEEKWKLEPDEKDMIVMIHEIGYKEKGITKIEKCSLVVTGDDNTYTAMAKTVGLPLGIAGRLILNGKYRHSGVQIPISADIYTPVLKELEEQGIRFESFF